MHFKIGRFRLPTICLKSPEMLCEGFRFAEILGSKFKSEVICGLRSTSSLVELSQDPGKDALTSNGHAHFLGQAGISCIFSPHS